VEPGRISERQLAFIITTTLIATVVFFMPQIAARALDNDAWISALIATVWGILSSMIIVALARRYSGLTMIEYLPLILGRPLGKMLCLLYSFWFLSVGAIIVREFGVLLNVTIMLKTPVGIFMTTLMILCFYAVRSGLEVWARVNEALLPVILLAMIAIIVFPFQQMDFNRLLPVAKHSIGNMLYTSLAAGSWRGEVILAGMFIPALASFRHTKRNLIIAVAVIGFILTAVEVATIAVFGGVNTGQMEFPLFSLARMISVADIFERLEVLIVIIWVLGCVFKLCAFLYCATLATAQTLGFKEYQFLLLPIAILMLALAGNAFGSVVELIDFLTNVWPGYGLFSFSLIIPLLLYLISLFRISSQKSTS